MAPSQIEYRGEPVRIASPSGALPFQNGTEDNFRAARPESIWQVGLLAPLLEIALFWIAALACLVAFSIWAL